MTGTVGRIRNPWVVILLSIVTLGIYGLYWQYATFKEMKEYSGTGVGGGVGLLFAFFLSIVNWFLMPAEVGALFSGEGRPRPVSGLTGFWVFLPIVGFFVWVVKTQGHLNSFWQAHGAVAGGSVAPPAGQPAPG
jgi:ABC-type Fe3+-siderophore transport system permease subunit